MSSSSFRTAVWDRLPDCLPLSHYFGTEMKEVPDLFVLTGRSRNRNQRIGCRIQSEGCGFDMCSPSSFRAQSHRSNCYIWARLSLQRPFLCSDDQIRVYESKKSWKLNLEKDTETLPFLPSPHTWQWRFDSCANWPCSSSCLFRKVTKLDGRSPHSSAVQKKKQKKKNVEEVLDAVGWPDRHFSLLLAASCGFLRLSLRTPVLCVSL